MKEADIQVLASIRRAEVRGEATDRTSLDDGADRYWKYLEDWSGSWQSLLTDGLIQGDDSGYSLTESGRPLAEHYYAERPDHFWYYYQHYYPAAQASHAHSQLCERVFGKDLTQDGQADMNSLNDLVSYLDIREGDRVLDLGCGAGGISEYLSDATGAHVTGLDYAATAIETAGKRTVGKEDRLAYVQGDMNALEFPNHSFDKIVSIDTIYWVADIDEALDAISKLVEPGGRMGIFIANTPQMDDSPGAYELHGTWVAKSLKKLNLAYDAYDYTESFLSFWPRMKEVALELRDEFVAEGNEVIFDSFMLDADEDYLPAAEEGKLRRFLYVVSV
ncbi:MAG: class I SAM-dependent methyltransferase [Woeseiaceae bacterium]